MYLYGRTTSPVRKADGSARTATLRFPTYQEILSPAAGRAASASRDPFRTLGLLGLIDEFIFPM